MINKFAILILNKEIKKNYLYFLAEVFRNIISFSELHHYKISFNNHFFMYKNYIDSS